MGMEHSITKSGELGCRSCVGDMGMQGCICKENYYKEKCGDRKYQEVGDLTIRRNRVRLRYIHKVKVEMWIGNVRSCA